MSAAGMYASEPQALNPFPGLRPFEPDEDYLFFGREKQTDELLRKLRTTRFLSILGRSGSGKSSLVRSGMIPALWGGGMTVAGSRWRVAIMRPGDDPIGNLAAVLGERGVLFDDDTDTPLTRAFFETTLRASHGGLIECIEQARLPEGNNVLLLVDQFEELFRYKRSRRVIGRDEAVAFVKLLLTARESESVRCYIAVTMRSDFIGDCMEFGNLPEVINDGIYLVPRMTRDELRSAITGPVAVGGATIAPRLVSRLLNEVGDDPDQLPILQHALMRTWDRWEEEGKPDEPLDLQHYEAIGTLHTALSRHAEECYGELDPRGQEIAEKLFRALTDKASDVRGVRRPAPVSEICALTGATLQEVTAVVDTFRKPGRSFLMPPVAVELRSDSILDISHESLMRIWERLSSWADEEARSGQLYLNVAKAAQRHEEGLAALWRDPELQLALTWRDKEHPTEEWASRYDTSFARAMRFLDASRDERDRELREKEASRRNKLRRARILLGVFSALSLVLLALGAFALTQKTKAVAAQHRAEQALVEVQSAQHRAEAEKLRAESEKVRAEKQKQRAEGERLRAEQEKQRAETNELEARTKKAEAEASRAEAVKAQGIADLARKNAEASRTVAVEEKKNADVARGNAEASAKETLRLSHLAAARALALSILQLKDPQTSGLLALQDFRLNRDNGGNPEDPDVFAALRTAHERLVPDPIVRQAGNIRAIGVTPEGRHAIAAGDDGRILRFDLDHGGKPAVLASASGPIRSMAVAGHRVAVGTDAGTVDVFDTGNPGAPHRIFAAGHGVVTALAFAPSGDKLASANLDGTVMLSDAEGSGPGVTLQSSEAKRVTSVAFSPDGKSLAAGRAQGGALLWHLAQPSEAPRMVCNGIDVRSVAFRPDGKLLACGSGRGEITVTPLDGGKPRSLLGHASSVNALSFSPDGAFLASASSDNTVRLWDVTGSNAHAIVLPGHQSWVWAVAFTPDGERVVSGSEDRTLRVWPAHARLLAGGLCKAVKGNLTESEWTRYLPNVEYQPELPCPVKGARE
ncbi:MAG TPA: hypothetical protein VGR95_12330 [Thermoanaerobaculia bacterium]|nr:hypothetical protein [Thermoanaerobaculia bacterium]